MFESIFRFSVSIIKMPWMGVEKMPWMGVDKMPWMGVEIPWIGVECRGWTKCRGWTDGDFGGWDGENFYT